MVSREESMGQPFLWLEHGAPLEVEALRLDILEDKGRFPRRRILLLGGPRVEPSSSVQVASHFTRYSSEFCANAIGDISKARRRT